MLPGKGRVVAGNSGSPQLENGAGSSPFSGQGGAGGCRAPTGANTWAFQILCWFCTSRSRLGILIGVAEALSAPADSQLASVSARIAPPRRSVRADMREDSSLTLVWTYGRCRPLRLQTKVPGKTCANS